MSTTESTSDHILQDAPVPLAPKIVPVPGSPSAAIPDAEVREQVRRLMSGINPANLAYERRQDQRFAFPYLIHLNPVREDGRTPFGNSVVVVGKHLSPRGLDFYHREALPYRRMIVSLPTRDGHWLSFLIDLSWCRFIRHGWYESGGRFLQTVPSPMERGK